MNAEALIQVVLAGLMHLAELQSLLGKLAAEGRSDLTAEEVAMVRGKAVAANDALQAAIEARMPGN